MTISEFCKAKENFKFSKTLKQGKIWEDYIKEKGWFVPPTFKLNIDYDKFNIAPDNGDKDTDKYG